MIQGKDLCDHVAEMESLFNKLQAMGSAVHEDMRVAFLLTYVADIPDFTGIDADIKTIYAEESPGFSKNRVL